MENYLQINPSLCTSISLMAAKRILHGVKESIVKLFKPRPAIYTINQQFTNRCHVFSITQMFPCLKFRFKLGLQHSSSPYFNSTRLYTTLLRHPVIPQYTYPTVYKRDATLKIRYNVKLIHTAHTMIVTLKFLCYAMVRNITKCFLH